MRILIACDLLSASPLVSAPTIQAILRDAFPEYERTHRLPPYLIRAARAMIACRTAAMGGHVQACPHGHVQRVWYNSCTHRSCPQCRGLRLEQWLSRQRGCILDCTHYHTIFTVPQELNELWQYNKRLFGTLLFQSVRDTLTELFADEKHLGGTAGMLMALHSWGRNLSDHPHIHCLVTGGGLTEDGRWVEVKRKCLLPRKVVMILFRGKLLDRLRSGADAGTLSLPPKLRLAQLKGLLNKLGRQTWNVKILEGYTRADGVLTYLGRYLRGGPLSNGQLLSYADGLVRFRHQDHREVDESGKPATKVADLAVDEFLRRLLNHVPLPGMHTVRSYGLYAGAKREALNTARCLLGQAAVCRPEPITWQALLAKLGRESAVRCPVCGAELVCCGEFRRGRSPPVLESARRATA